MIMRIYDAHTISDDEIVLMDYNELPDLYEDIQQEKTFIIRWGTDSADEAQVFIGNVLLGKVNNNETTLKAMVNK